MTHSRFRFIAIFVAMMALLLAACAPATPTATPRPTNTAVPPTTVAEATAETAATSEATTEATQEAAVTLEATSETTAEATQAAAATTEATQEAAVTLEATSEVAAATSEATTEVAVAPTTVPTEAPAATTEATVEATVEATTAPTTEPTVAPTTAPTEAPAATTEATVEATSEATTEATTEATVEATTAPTEVAAATEEPAPPTSYSGAFSFNFPEGWRLNAATNKLVQIGKGDELISFYGPDSYNEVIGGQTFDSDQLALEFFLTRTGLKVSPAAAGDKVKGELAKASVELTRRKQAGTAVLLDLANGRKGVAVWLAPAGSEPSADAVAAFGTVIDSAVYPADLVDVAGGNADISTFLAAAQAAGIDLRSGEYTVFAPSNDAIAASLSSMGMTQDELLASGDYLAALINYHLVEGKMKAADLVAGDLATVNGQNITIAKDGDKVTVNDATVTTADIEASNGVIHVIDKVLVPAEMPALPTAEPTAAPTEEATAAPTSEATSEATQESASVPSTGTIVEIAVANPDFSTLVAAIQAAGLTEMLSGEGPYTVFAPTNEAFAAALSSMNMTPADLLANKDLLTKVLQYHVIPGKMLAADLKSGDVVTAEGSTVTLTVDGGKVMVNDATVTTADIAASNGVIHVIDKVLMPAMESAAPTEEATQETAMATTAATEVAAATTAATEVATTVASGTGAKVTIKAGEVVRIGLAAAFSGEGLAQYGIDIRRGVELALEDKGSVTVGGKEFKVELDAQDDLCSAEGGQTVANRFAADPSIVGVIGPMCSSGAAAAVPIFDAAGYTTISPSATALDLTNGKNTSFNRTVSSDRTQGQAAAEFIYNELNVRKAAILDDGSAYGKGLADLVAAHFTELGGEVVQRDAVTVGDTDFRALLEDISSKEPELIYFGGFNAEAARLITQREDVGLEKTIFMGADGMYGPEVIELAGKAAEGVYASAASPASSDALTAFHQRYVDTYKEEPASAFNTNSYDAANIFMMAIEAVGTVDADGNLVIDRQALSDYIRNLKDYAGLSSTMNCGGNGDCATTDVTFYQVKDGAFGALKTVKGG